MARSVSSEPTDIEIVPKRESLRRVLELSKQEYESKKNTENPISTESEAEDSESDEPKTEPGKFYSRTRSDFQNFQEISKVFSDVKSEPVQETQQKEVEKVAEKVVTPKKVPIMPKASPTPVEVKPLQVFFDFLRHFYVVLRNLYLLHHTGAL